MQDLFHTVPARNLPSLWPSAFAPRDIPWPGSVAMAWMNGLKSTAIVAWTAERRLVLGLGDGRS